MLWNRDQTLLGASNSSQTSPDIFVGDCRFITVSVETSTGSASNITISLSNAGGLGSTAVGSTTYSVVTVLPNAGIFTIDSGARWIKAERANIAVSATSNTTVMCNRTYQS